MAVPESQMRAIQKYNSERDQIRVFVPRDIGAKIRLAAETQGVPLGTFISESALARIDNVAMNPVNIDRHANLKILINSYQEAHKNLIEINKIQAQTLAHFISCADALKKAIEEV